MRLRLERKIRKRMRRLKSGKLRPNLVKLVDRYEREGLALSQALRSIMTNTDSTVGWMTRGDAAKLLAIAEDFIPTRVLLDQFFKQQERIELWETALALEQLGDRRAIGRLIEALHDENPPRRHAAARPLGWISNPGSRAVSALIDALTDHSQPQLVREEAAESLAYTHSRRAVPPLISVLADPDERIRFFAAFALGSLRDRRAIPALEAMLSDHAVPSGGWWSVAREALAALGTLDPKYKRRLEEEVARVNGEAEASQEDRRWSEFYNQK